jgi:hypothetical protein
MPDSGHFDQLPSKRPAHCAWPIVRPHETHLSHGHSGFLLVPALPAPLDTTIEHTNKECFLFHEFCDVTALLSDFAGEAVQ